MKLRSVRCSKNELLFIDLLAPPPCRHYGLDRSLCQFQVAPSAVPCSSQRLAWSSATHLNNTAILWLLREIWTYTRTWIHSRPIWVDYKHTRLKGKRRRSLRPPGKHGAFLNAPLGSADCTSARLGMLRSGGFNRAANDLTARPCNKPDIFCQHNTCTLL